MSSACIPNTFLSFFRYACDMKVVTLLRQRTLGNSPTQLQRQLEEQHADRWMARTLHYLSNCDHFAKAQQSGLLTQVTFDDPPPALVVPKYGWIQTVYCNDVQCRAEDIKASITSTFGKVLKMDSTKKVSTCRKFFTARLDSHFVWESGATMIIVIIA